MTYTLTFGSYTFPQEGLTINTNFGDAVPITTRLPGVSGGFNEDGAAMAPLAIGRVTVSFTLGYEVCLKRQGYTTVTQNNLEDALQKELDTLKTLVSGGLQKLTKSEGTLASRYTWARVNFISETVKPFAGLFYVPMQVIFQAPIPVWLAGSYEGLKFGSGAGKFGAGLKFGSGALTQAVSGTSTSFTVTNNGNMTSVMDFNLTPQSAGKQVQNPIIQRLENGSVVDQIAYTGTVVYPYQLEVSGSQGFIRVSGANALGSSTYLHPDFLRLKPGANSLRVICSNAGDQATLYMYFNDSYL